MSDCTSVVGSLVGEVGRTGREACGGRSPACVRLDKVTGIIWESPNMAPELSANPYASCC